MKKSVIVLFSALFVIGFGGCASMQLREAVNLYNKGDNEYKKEKYNEALGYFEKALNIFRIEGHDENTAATLHYIGSINKKFGKYDKSLTFFKDALKINKKLNIPKNIATDLNEIGLIYDSLGKYEEALKYYEESLKIFKKLNNPKSIAITLGNIGAVYRSLGQYDKALSYYNESLKIYRELKIPQDIAMSLNNIGGVYLSQNKYKEAEDKFLDAEKEMAKMTGVKLSGNSGMVDVYLSTGRYEKALTLLKDMSPRWNTDDPLRIQYHTQHGLALKGNGMFKEASSEFLKAVSISEEMRRKGKEKTGFFSGGTAGNLQKGGHFLRLWLSLQKRARGLSSQRK
ncbi:MAG: DUF2225 domain-containing protein [Nitrospinae bacterium]|nr:DUF2225 domain-containing protein [Nitrospinota bacterium]